MENAGEHVRREDERPCVLVVEPEALVRWALREYLGRRGLRVLGAETPGEARPHAGEAHVVVIDVRMREREGLDLAAELRRLRPGCPLILVTPDSSPQLEQRAHAVGLSIALEKPYELGRLARLIEAHLEPGPQPRD